jgi:glutamate racemase
LVQLAEHKLRGDNITAAQLAANLQPFFDHPQGHKMDVLVLACTHFPLLRDEIGAQFAPEVQLIDSGEAIARRVASLIEPCDLAETTPEHLAVFTKASAGVDALQPQLAQFGIYNTLFITI